MKTQPWQRDPEAYDFQFTITPLFFHLDVERHVNNVAVQSFHTEGRLRYLMNVSGADGIWCSDQVLLRPRRTVTQFLEETHYLTDVQCAVKLVAVDKDSCRFVIALFQNGECTSVQDCLMGAWRDGQWQPLPASLFDTLSARLGEVPELAPWPDFEAGPEADQGYPCRTPLEPRFIDQDTDRRLGELTIARYLEQSRVSSLDAMRLPGLGLLVARIDIHYLDWPAPLHSASLATGIAGFGNSSFRVHSGARVNDVLVGACESVMVLMNREQRRPTQIDEAMREAMAGSLVQG
ncbi:acyl-CoA thioesterase FadM [Alloalcanivorax xenomutans]|uniref:hypothetical protein n=1 Tax=Alloalcanivorax xenomutans TaxID=1094342 RepID=UPI000BC63ED1|nr:hypothetical protein [Alloalcanivorax xenomutans]SOB95893.1 acyl-CoA thioesterase FadM [Alloalcanivorax xenomutans]